MKRHENIPGRVVCFGEILLRLSAPNGELLLQSPRMAAHIGGAEANVAVSLANFGHDAAMASALPDNQLGQLARGRLREHGVDTRGIQFQPGRMGLYFLTHGAVLRPSEVIYDRDDSVFARMDPSGYDWDTLLDGANWLHVSGVCPAVGERAAHAAIDGVRAARRLGVKVAFDGNYRASLWARQGHDGAGTLYELMSNADLLFADQRDIALVLGRPALAEPRHGASAIAAAFEAFPQLSVMAATRRIQHSVGQHDLSASLYTRDATFNTPAVALNGIIDRIGTGDAFAAGILHGLLQDWSHADTLAFGMAAAALKHSIIGDFNPVSEAQVRACITGGLDVRR
jgi:2-dehydro-3-deoxygluconokinase